MKIRKWGRVLPLLLCGAVLSGAEPSIVYGAEVLSGYVAENVSSAEVFLDYEEDGTAVKAGRAAGDVFSQPEILTASSQDTVGVTVYGKEEYKKAFQVLSIVNQERKKAGLDGLAMDASMLNTAMLRAFETVLYWSHSRPDGSSCFTANHMMYGENIAWGSSTAVDVMNLWMNSEGHRANILGGYKSIGIGCVEVNGRYYWVQCFGNAVNSRAKKSDYPDRNRRRQVQVKKDAEHYKASFKIPKTKITVGETVKPKVYWDGMELKKSAVTVKSSNPSVCQVKNGAIKGIRKGTARITIYYEGYPEKAQRKTVTVRK